jgi:hypothetical protein
MLLEGYAAWMAAARADRANDGRVVESLRVIAADETNHAALAADVLDWCLEQGGRAVADLIATAASQLPAHPPLVVPTVSLDAPSLAGHGLFDADPEHQVWAALVESVRAEVDTRLARPEARAA